MDVSATGREDRITGDPPRPGHLHWRQVGLVAAGGALGTLLRHSVSAFVPTWNGLPLATLAANTTGAFLLGMLVEFLARGGPDTGRRRSIRLCLGTGVLGGYTTYSSLALETQELLAGGAVANGLLYGLTTVIAGAVASAAGVAAGAAVHRARVGNRESA